MKRVIVFSAVVLCSLASLAFTDTDDEAEKAVIKKAIEDFYFEGQKYRNSELLSKIFHESAHLHAVLTDGKFWTMPAPEWIHRKGPRKDPPNHEYFVDEIQITGTSASVTARTVTENWIVIDYLNMLKIDGKWMIVSKIFYSIKK